MDSIEVAEILPILSELEASELSQTGMPAPPFIVRMAGLPGESLLDFASPACFYCLESERALLSALAEARAVLVNALAEVLPRQDPKLRRFLLSIKRDSFNHRNLCQHSSRLEWREVDPLVGGLAGKVLELEHQAAEVERKFEEIYESELERERLHLYNVVRDERFLRGLALGSPELVCQARELLNGTGSLGRHGKKVEQSLLRFVTRAAAKLSPYSTLTTLGLGLLEEEILAGFHFVPGPLRELSLVRANSSLFNLGRELLMLHPLVRSLCPVVLNDTAREIGKGRWQLLRNGHWAFNEDLAALRFIPAQFIRVELAGPIIASLQEFLAGGPLPLEAVVECLRERYPERENEGDGCSLRSLLDRLIALGFLCLLPPWRTSEVHVEKRMLEMLHGLPLDAVDPTLRNLETALEELLELEGEYAAAPRPEVSSLELKAALDQVLGEIDNVAKSNSIPKVGRSLYEDVFAASFHDEASAGEVIRLSACSAREVMISADLISRFACLFNHRHDILHTLAAIWAERWPSRQEIGALELFQEFQGLWSRYLRFDRTERYDYFSTFDPLDLPAVEALGQIRKTVRESTRSILKEGSNGVFLPSLPFRRLLDTVPRLYRPLLGCAVFLQPADLQGQTWVLNRLFEGSGRYLSRYPAAMEEPMRSRFTSHLTSRSSVEIAGEQFDLLDLVFTQGSMTNLHFPQTRRVLEMPGERLDLPPGRRVRLSELRIEANLETEEFRLIDIAGRPLIPVHLSSLNNLFVSPLLRFLSIFGPYEVRQVFPRARMETTGGVSVCRRLTCDNLVVRRARWEISKEVLEGIAISSKSVAFRNLQIWRESWGMPRHVFVFEKMHQDGDPVQSFKPQYIDFSSPTLTSLFFAIIRKNGSAVIIEEALPIFSEFPLDAEGQRRALEFQIDSMAL